MLNNVDPKKGTRESENEQADRTDGFGSELIGPTEVTLYSQSEIRSACEQVFEGLDSEFVELCGRKLDLYKSLVRQFTYEWITPQSDGVYGARSYELSSSIGSGTDKTRALRAAIQSDFMSLFQRSRFGMELPRPVSKSVTKPKLEASLTVRLTRKEIEALKELANIQSKTMSSIVREKITYMASSPTEEVLAESI